MGVEASFIKLQWHTTTGLIMMSHQLLMLLRGLFFILDSNQVDAYSVSSFLHLKVPGNASTNTRNKDFVYASAGTEVIYLDVLLEAGSEAARPKNSRAQKESVTKKPTTEVLAPIGY